MRYLTVAVVLAVWMSILPLAPADETATSLRASADPLSRAIADPGATGLLVTRVQPRTQAAKAGIIPGDILVAYGGEPTPDIPALNYAKKSVGDESRIALGLVRGLTRIETSIGPGRIGVILITVEKGKGREPLPAGTGVKLDFSSLEKADRDDWYIFYRGAQRCGIGHIRVRLVGDRIFVLSQEIYDPGTGIVDHRITTVVTATDHPTPVMTTFRDRMNDWVRIGLRSEAPDGGATWNVVLQGEDTDEKSSTQEISAKTVPVYAMETLAGLMPRKRGSCLRFEPLFEGSGGVGLEGALVCLGEEEILHNDRKMKTSRFEWRQLDGVLNGTYWVGGDSRVLRATYGPINVVLTTREDAERDQPQYIRARLAK